MNCNICGSENLIKGTIYGMTGTGASSASAGFIPDETSVFRKMFAMGGREIQSYGCIHCGNLQFLVDFSEADKQHYLEFHQPPPSVTEPDKDSSMLDEKLEISE
ncbi:MAG: hypothetical protein M3033_04255 [Acidobacteriota bacterium]|nr:hypothetical protein [Acidobacteriota bacterium]